MSDKVAFRVNYTEVMNDEELAKLATDCKKEEERGHDVSLTVVMTKDFDIYDEEDFLRRLLDVLPFKRIRLEDDSYDGLYCQQSYELQEFLNAKSIGCLESNNVQHYFFAEKVITLGYAHQNCMHVSACVPGTMRQV